MKNPLKVGQQVFFTNEKLPMTVMATSDRYAVVSRKLHRREDADLLHHKVKMDAYSSFTEAFENCKDLPVYSILDFEENIKGPDNLIFGDFDYSEEKDCVKAIKDLENGRMEITHRNRVDLNIDWAKTKSL